MTVCICASSLVPVGSLKRRGSRRLLARYTSVPVRMYTTTSTTMAMWYGNRHVDDTIVRVRVSGGDVPGDEESVLDWTRTKIQQWCESVATMDATHELLKFCMMLSLEELALVHGGSDVKEEYLQRGTWSLQNIKNTSARVKELFIKGLSEDEWEIPVNVLAEKYPATLASTINAVLFEHQGYQRMKQFGNLECFQLSNVLDNGVSCPILLAIVYMAVSEECGMPLHALVLEEGSYVVLWPHHGNFSSCVIDPYAQGILISEEEIAELFELQLPLQPSSLQDIARAIVMQVLYTCWSAALQVPPEPAFRIPISLEVALGEYQDVSYSYGGKDVFLCLDDESETSRAYMSRCISAGEKLLLLSQHSNESKLQLAILCYFSKDYNKAAELLDQLISAIDQGQPDWLSTNPVDMERMKLLYSKCVLCSSYTSL